MEQLDFVEELLDSWRDTLVNQLAAAATEEELRTNFATTFLKDRRVFPGTEEGWANSSRKRRRLSDKWKRAEEPPEADQQEVTD